MMIFDSGLLLGATL